MSGILGLQGNNCQPWQMSVAGINQGVCKPSLHGQLEAPGKALGLFVMPTLFLSSSLIFSGTGLQWMGILYVVWVYTEDV